MYLSKKGLKVAILEKENRLFSKASIVNQARLHSGYHYPRSVATALMSDDNKARFTADHEAFINFSFEKYYAVDKFGSFTDAAQFERFCDFIRIKCKPVHEHPHINFHRLDALFSTTEYTFDPILIAEYYKEKIQDDEGINVYFETEILNATKNTDAWSIRISYGSNTATVTANAVVNATYSGSNAINRLFGVEEINLMHEISEMSFVTSPQIKNIGLTVMDGPFGSIMPYGKSGLLSLSSVAYTHHKVSYDALPSFDCQSVNTACRPDYTSICNDCFAKPRSNHHKMTAQIKHYFKEHVELHHFTSMFTIKSKLMANYIDDGRPTEIRRFRKNPDFYCIFAGKINSIYEIEKALEL